MVEKLAALLVEKKGWQMVALKVDCLADMMVPILVELKVV